MSKTCYECGWDGNSDWAQECELCGTALGEAPDPKDVIKDLDIQDKEVVL
jgi:hypothetical protein